MSGRYAPERCRLIPPQGGWESHTWYIVDVEYCSTNPRHRSLFYSGFCQQDLPGNPGCRADGRPGSYNVLVPLNGPDNDEPNRGWEYVTYLRVVRKLISEKEARK